MATHPRDDETDRCETETPCGRTVPFDPETDSVIETIVTAVADLEDESPTALDPLYDAIDPDALQAILDSTTTRSDPADVSVTVRYHGYAVTINGYGTVEIAG